MKRVYRCDFFLFCVTVFLHGYVKGELNNRPILGVMTQEIQDGNNKDSFIPASYVKAIEGAGARVVPIFINQTEEYYREILSHVNGVVIPGGGTNYASHGGLSDAVNIVYNISKEINSKERSIFPILGICQGFQLLAYVSNFGKNPLVQCSASDVNLPLKFKKNYRKSHLYKYMPGQFIKFLKQKPITINHHSFCLTEKSLKKEKLNKQWKVLSTNFDEDGLKFISSMESRKYPFVGLQFHPEKAAYAWTTRQKNNHEYSAILVNRYFYDYIVKLSRFNMHHFPDEEMERRYLIDNYTVSYTPEGFSTSVYFFSNTESAAYQKLNLPASIVKEANEIVSRKAQPI